MNEMVKNSRDFISREVFKYKLEICTEKEMQYGLQVFLCDINGSYEDNLPVNIYFSAKKGLSFVVGGSPKSPLRSRVDKLVEEVKIASRNYFHIEPLSGNKKNHTHYVKPLHNWNKWIGTDESGKGDFFGPLVASGFYCDAGTREGLLKIGVADSKVLKSKQIMKIAHQLYRQYNNRIETIILLPKTYNRLYADFALKGKKLNEMMSWMHSRIILNLSNKFPAEGALVDKFTDEYKLRAALKEMKDFNLIVATKAESDLGVAAASIIARYHFLKELDTLSKRFSITLLKGANSQVINTGKEFIKLYSTEQLSEVCKVHFKTYGQVTGQINNQSTIEFSG